MDKYRYKILEEIGKGSFGRVFKAKKIRSNYAIKKVRCDAPENVELALQEFWTLSTLRAHNNIIRFEECYLQHGEEIRPMKHGDKFSPGYMYLVEMAIKGKRGWDQAQYYLWFVMEYCNCGDMNDYILDRDPITYLNTIFMLQLADGMAFLHKSNVVHRDLKPENILVRALKGKDPILKIADFGLSKVCNRPAKDSEDGPRDYDCDINVDTCWLSSACGSDFFMAPEVFEGRYTAKADVFALGIMFWAIMDRITFIDAGTKKVLLGTYVRRDKEVLPVGEALLDDPNLDMTQLLVDTGQGPASGQRSKRSQLRSCVAGNKKKLRDLIAQMVHPNPEFRPSSQELLGKLTSVLQPNERPKNMDLTAKKSSVAKIDTILRVEENKCSTENVLPGAETKIKDMNAVSGDRTASNKISETVEKKQAQNRKHEKETQESKTTKRGRRKGHTKNANLQLSPEETNPQAQKVVGSTKKAKRKLSSKAQKSKLVTRNLRSSSRKFEVSKIANKKGVAPQKENNKNSNSSESIQSCPISVVKEADTYASDSKSQLPVEEGMEVPAQGNISSHSNKAKLNLRNFVSAAKKVEKPKVISSPVPSLESDEGADFLTDGDSRDSSIVSEVPEFDSGYKSKKSRRISHIVEDTLLEPADKEFSSDGPSKEQMVNSEEKQNERYPAPIAISESQDLHPPRLHHRPQIGLKQQIRACKPNADIEVSRPYYKSNYSYDSSVPATKIPQFEAKLTNAPETPSKPKIEVPRTPCVVMQSKAKFRHNPFHTAVKKRWKYVVLDDFPPPLTNEISLAVKKRDEETAPSKDEMLHVPVKPASDRPHLQMTEHQSSTKHDISSIMNSPQTIPSAPVRKKRDFVKTIEQKYIMPEQEAQRQSYSHIDSSIMPSPPNEQILLKSNKNQPSSSHRDVVHVAKKVHNFQTKACPPQNANVNSGTESDHLPPYPQDPLVSTHRQQEGMVVKKQNTTSTYQNQSHAFQHGPSRRYPEHAQDPMLQQLTKYWCPSKKIHENPSKSKETLSDARHKSSQKTSLSMTQSPKYPQFLLSCQKTHRTARGRATGTSRQSKSSESSSIPTIDLTLDDNDDFQPSKKRPRYEETTKYPLQKSRRKFHDPRQSNEISAGTSGAKVVRCGCSNCGKYGTKSNHHSGVSPQASHLGSANPPRLISFQPHISPSHLHLGQEPLQRAYTLSESPHYRSDSFSPRSDSSQDLYSLFQRSPQTSSPQSIVRPLQMHSYGVVRDERGSGSPSLAHYLHGHLAQNRQSPFTGRTTTMPVFADGVQHPVPPMPKMPSLLYCGSHSPMSSPDRGQVLQRSPPNLQKIDELNRRVSQQMQQQQVYLSPPKLQRASTVPSMIPPFPGNVVHSPNNNYSTPASSNMCTYPGYPYHLRHQKPILNK